MQRTILRTPIAASVARSIARVYMFVSGWRLDGELPPAKCVITAAPHTSNWDFVLSMAVCWSANVPVHWMGKDTLFPPGFGWIMKWFGGIPVDRTRGHNVAKQALHMFRNSDEFQVIIPPEGTRSRVDGWKLGFYLIAKTSKVPVVCGYLDYKKKLGGFGPTIHPSGDTKADLGKMWEFYQGVTGKYPELASRPFPECGEVETTEAAAASAQSS